MATRRRRRNADSLKLTGAQAQYLMNRFLKERRISIRDVDIGLASLRHDIGALEDRLRILRSASTDKARANASASRAEPRAAKRRRQNLSPERRAALKLQGHYLALMRQVPKTKRAGFTTLFKTKGAQSAIDALRKLLGK